MKNITITHKNKEYIIKEYSIIFICVLCGEEKSTISLKLLNNEL